ncbi:MAG: hypothetical protein ACI82O_001612, partial [Patiriisocius sp.]
QARFVAGFHRCLNVFQNALTGFTHHFAPND